MVKKINFTEQELSNLIDVLKIVEPKIGIAPDHLYRTYDVVFRKTYESKLGFAERGYIDSDKCYIKIGGQQITAREITYELIDRNILVKFRTIMEDENGNQIFHDKEKMLPVRRTLYKTLMI